MSTFTEREISVNTLKPQGPYFTFTSKDLLGVLNILNDAAIGSTIESVVSSIEDLLEREKFLTAVRTIQTIRSKRDLKPNSRFDVYKVGSESGNIRVEVFKLDQELLPNKWRG